jgi:hypothetical protein
MKYDYSIQKAMEKQEDGVVDREAIRKKVDNCIKLLVRGKKMYECIDMIVQIFTLINKKEVIKYELNRY